MAFGCPKWQVLIRVEQVLGPYDLVQKNSDEDHQNESLDRFGNSDNDDGHSRVELGVGHLEVNQWVNE